MSLSEIITNEVQKNIASKERYINFMSWRNGLSLEEVTDLDEALKTNAVSVRRLHKVLKEQANVSWSREALYYYKNEVLTQES